MSVCRGCEALPPALPTSGTLYLWPPLGHTARKLATGLGQCGFIATEHSPDCLAIAVSPAMYEALGDFSAQSLSAVEQDECRCLLSPDGSPPAIGDLGRVTSLSRLLTLTQGRWLVDLLAERRLETHFQPIVRADAPTEVFAYECLLRGVDARQTPISPAKLYDTARSAGLLYHLDRVARLQHIAASTQLPSEVAVFINFNPTAIYDPQYCLQSTIAAIRQSNLPARNFVFEVVESDHVADIEQLPRILDFYREAGFRVALDDLGAGFSSLNLLSTLRPDFIKLDMQLVRGVDSNPYKGEIVGKLIQGARNLGIQVVAEGIETIGEWNWVATHGADYVQGYLFARPSKHPPSSYDPLRLWNEHQTELATS